MRSITPSLFGRTPMPALSTLPREKVNEIRRQRANAKCAEADQMSNGEM
jgi:hypothetical protein